MRTIQLIGMCALIASCAPPPEPVITLSEFQSLSTGISPNDAKGIIGDYGTEISRSEVAGITTVMLSWQNPDGSNANAMFQDGRLMMKAQFGLK